MLYYTAGCSTNQVVHQLLHFIEKRRADSKFHTGRTTSFSEVETIFLVGTMRSAFYTVFPTTEKFRWVYRDCPTVKVKENGEVLVISNYELK